MTEETVFENINELKDIVKSNYGIKITSIKKIIRGSANIYSLNNNKYILKEFQSNYKKEDIIKEITVINHLKKNKIKVPKYIKTLKGDSYFFYKDKYIILQKYIDGYTKEQNTGNINETLESAKYLGKIVKALKSLNYNLNKIDYLGWLNTETLNNAINKYKSLIKNLDLKNELDKKIYYDLNDKIKMINCIKNKFNKEEINNLTIVNSHGDYSVMQFIYKNKKIHAVIDFVAAAKVPIIWEIIRSYSYIDEDVKNGEFNINTFIKYVKTVNKYITLNEYDIKYMPYLYLVQMLNSDYGYKEYINNKTKKELLNFAIFRTKLCRYLFKNSELISKELRK